jgi:hypothetical protein
MFCEVGYNNCGIHIVSYPVIINKRENVFEISLKEHFLHT